MLKEVLQALITALVGVLLVIIPILGKYFASFVGAKLQEQKYANAMNVARNVWGIVEEYFRTNPGTVATIESKINLFESEILKKCPYLTQDEIDHLRQAIAGAVNQGKGLVAVPTPVTPIVKYVAPDGTELQPVQAVQTVPGEVVSASPVQG